MNKKKRMILKIRNGKHEIEKNGYLEDNKICNICNKQVKAKIYFLETECTSKYIEGYIECPICYDIIEKFKYDL